MSGRKQISDYPESIQQQIALQLKIGGKVSGPIIEPIIRNDILEPTPNEAPDSGRYVVRIISYRRKLLDLDNLWGGCKYFLDGLRMSSVIPDDRPELCHFEASQVRVRLKSEERTEITVTSPGYVLDSQRPTNPQSDRKAEQA